MRIQTEKYRKGGERMIVQRLPVKSWERKVATARSHFEVDLIRDKLKLLDRTDKAITLTPQISLRMLCIRREMPPDGHCNSLPHLSSTPCVSCTHASFITLPPANPAKTALNYLTSSMARDFRILYDVSV